ncbi:protein FAR1-RELATED SEQUENCE 5-like [Cornus florida]|uniref:protein FAR1-RELATED SEQUENCE 5-like n=1 Tax=Cornus florida TaxID=4283 RepID=UPI00289B909D|nr:protein FAR1-RELATED SEQUENCE 5-like [Cornus florida]
MGTADIGAKLARFRSEPQDHKPRSVSLKWAKWKTVESANHFGVESIELHTSQAPITLKCERDFTISKLTRLQGRISTAHGSGTSLGRSPLFDTEDEAYDFYNAYGGKVGFSIRKDYANKSRKIGNITTSKFVCSKQGFRVKDKRDIHTRKPRAETRTGCGALMQIRYDRKKGKYVVYNFVESHNHPMIIEECTHMMPSQRRISVAQAIDVELACQSGVPLGNAFELMSRQAGGDSRMIINYGHFGDVVTFDTTYKLVQSNRPFAAFLGLNHHRETAVFGLALMYDETANSFAWLFDAFLNAMSGKAPQTILTDQDGAMAKALAQVMPRTRHLLCTWHIMANAQKHVGTIFKNDEGIKSVLSQFMYCYDDEDDFCIQWDVMLRDYNVVGNTWLNNLFGLREKWGYPFVKHWFTAGMRTTQLSESLNSCLKEYLTRKMSIPDFFMHLDRLLSDKRYKEYQAEYGLLSKLPRLKKNCPILKQVGNMYTLKIFELFQDQFIEACVVGTVEGRSFDENGLRVSRVSVHDGSMDRTMTRWDDGFLTCSCEKYAMEGILCSHVLKVLKDDTQYFKELPSMYILKRWTRKARDNSVQDICGCEVIADPKLEVRRRKHINVERQCFDVEQKATNSAFSTERSNNHEHNESIIGQAVTRSNAKGIKNKETGGKGPRRRKKNKFEQYMQRKKNYAKRKKSNGNNSVSAGVGGSSTVPPITYVRLNGCDIPSDATWIYEDHHPCARLHSETNIDQMTYCPTTNFSHPRTPPTEQGTPFVSYHECRFSDCHDVDHTSGDRNLMPMLEETTSEINLPARQNLF